MPQCLQGTLNKRISCGGKGKSGKLGAGTAVGVPRMSARVLCNHITELGREEVSWLSPHKQHLNACDTDCVQSQEITAKSAMQQKPERHLVSSTLL